MPRISWDFRILSGIAVACSRSEEVVDWEQRVAEVGPPTNVGGAGTAGPAEVYARVIYTRVTRAYPTTALVARVLEGEWRAAAQEVVEALAAEDVPALAAAVPARVGAGVGLGSLAYALATAGVLLEDPRAVEAAVGPVRAMTDDVLRETPFYDVVEGHAGALLAALAVYEASGAAEALGRAFTNCL